MRCLSIRQPWAWAICAGQKTIENRTWATPHRGRIAIHASAGKQDANRALKQSKSGIKPDYFVFGAIIGVADVLDCVELNPDLEDDPWALGTICWKLGNARFFAKPIPMKGKLNLFELEPKLAAEVERQLEQAEPDLAGSERREVCSAVQPLAIDRTISQVQAYLHLGRFDDATRRSADAIALDPGGWEAYHLRAIAHAESDRYEAALEDANRAIELNPQAAYAYYYRAIAQDELGNETAMRADYEKARELGADLPPLEDL